MLKSPERITLTCGILLVILCGCQPPSQPPEQGAEIKPVPKAAVEPVAKMAVKSPLQEFPPALGVGEDPLQHYAGHWLLVNVGASWDAPFQEQVLDGMDGQKSLERLGVPVLHAYSDQAASIEGAVALPGSWSEAFEAQRTVSARLLVSPQGTVQRVWPGQPDANRLVQDVQSEIASAH